MRKFCLLLLTLLVSAAANAQVEYLYDFNNLTEGAANLNGQDNWSTHYQTASTSQDFDVAVVADQCMSPDETIGIFYPYGGPGVGRTATRKATDNFNFSFQNGGIMDLEIYMMRNWWGVFYGVGYDADGDGNILVGMTEGDGGVYIRTKGEGTLNASLHLPNGTSIDLDYYEGGWTHFKMSFDFNAYDGAGSVTVFARPNCEGEWIQLSTATNVNMGLTPGSGDANDYQVWDGIFFHSQGGTGGFDNLLVRQQPDGNVQYIDMPDIPKQLTINAPYTLTATATSGLDVAFDLVGEPDAVTLDGNVLTFTGQTGEVTVKASQAGNDEWLPAPDVFKTFQVINPMDYTPEVTIRRPYDGSMVYMPQLNSMLLVVSAYIEHDDAINIESVSCTIDGEVVNLHTDYPDDHTNGYFYNSWTPTRFGEHNMIVEVVTSGGKVTTLNSTFTVSDEYETMDVLTINGDLICTPSVHSAIGQYEIPSHVGAFNAITAYYDHNCVNGDCDAYDRFGGMKVRNHRGEWVEIFRYISPFGVQCEDNLDVSDYTSVLQGLVEFEFYFESWSGQGYNPTLTFNFQKGTPEYLYVDVNEIIFGTYAFGDYADQFPIPNINYDFAPDAEKATLKITTTGHNWSSNTAPNYTINTGNAAEFYEATHNVVINDEIKYTQHLWRECSPNPAGCEPQYGTYYYPRSGWCPGSIALVWDWDLSEYLPAGCADIFYQFDPTYIDECHPNHPDCVDNQGGCRVCDHPDNPVLKVAAKVLTFSNNGTVFDGVNPCTPPAPTYDVAISPNPADDNVMFSTDYQNGKLSVLILAMDGSVVKNFAFSGQRSVDVSDLSSGVYIVKIIGDSMITKKLVVK